MLARREMPHAFDAWNEQWNAPAGHFPRVLNHPANRRLAVHHRSRMVARFVGPFAFQVNNSTRAFEYPWAYSIVPIRVGSRVLDIGGSLAGFQFALDRSGTNVTNVDPGEEANGLGWPVDQERISWLNRAFGTNVRLENCTLEEAEFPPDHFDTAYSISVIEHIPPDEAASLMREIQRVLKPGGRFVMTLDLFTDLQPFTEQLTNEWGTNISVARLVEASGMELVVGDTSELYGYPAFDVSAIVQNLGDFFVGTNPTLIQCVVLRKPDESGPDR
jgi:2-polyprenyl-3-methyl-5-hydroxy-6-metoxy-1,4-benzoquinol methylase